MHRIAPTRRAMLALPLAAAAGLPRPALGASQAPEAATLLSPGPEEGLAVAFAQRAARGLGRSLAQAAALHVAVLGGADGITAANRFAASTPADGRALLLLPGAAGQALLVGDSRARFEPRHWPAVAGSLLPAILAGRGPLPPGQPVKLALPGPAAPEAAALLALEMLGVPGTPVYLGGGATAEALVAQGAADALVLAGGAVLARAAALGLTPWFALEAQGQPRHQELAGLPLFGELLPDPARPDLLEGLRAACAALRCRGLLVLPQLTSADVVAMWRGAAQRWVEAEPAGEEPGSRRLAPGEATAMLAALCPSPDGALAYREWLLRRLGWRAG
jgi:hypothetical protein